MKSLTDKQMDELERKGHVVILFPLVKTVVVDGCKYYRFVDTPEFPHYVGRDNKEHAEF